MGMGSLRVLGAAGAAIVAVSVGGALALARGPAAAPPDAPLTAGARADGPLVSFNRDVRPILADNCYACHGPDRNRRQRGLRLDREEVAKAALPSGRVAIVPGSAEKSELFRR